MAPDNSMGTGVENRRRTIAAASLLVLVTILAYLPVIHAGFIWDDNQLLTVNPLIRHVDGLRAIWFSSRPVDYTPVTLTAFWVEWRLWGETPTGYHLVNVALFAGSALLLWRVLCQLRIPGAWLGALLFAIHPVNTASVAWVAEQKNALALVFYLLTVSLFVDFQESRRLRNYLLALAAAALAMLSKGSTVILPAVLLICCAWMERRPRRRALMETAPFFLVAAAMSIVTIRFQQRDVTAGAVSWPFRLARAGDAVWFYLWKDIWPADLCAIYPKWEIAPEASISYLPLCAIALVFVFLWLGRRYLGGGPLFVWVYFLVALSPVLGLIEMSYMDQAYVADWWQQLALIGITALAGAGVARAWGRAGSYRKFGIAAAIVIATGSLAAVTWYEATGYRSLETYCRRTLALNPKAWNAWNNLGAALDKEKRFGEAILAFQRSLEINPDDPEMLYNLGNALEEEGRTDDAEQSYRQALAANPRFAPAMVNLGILLARRGDLQGALQGFEQAQQINPDDPQVYVDLGNVLTQEGQAGAATRSYERALELDPTDTEVRAHLEHHSLKP